MVVAEVNGRSGVVSRLVCKEENSIDGLSILGRREEISVLTKEKENSNLSRKKGNQGLEALMSGGWDDGERGRGE